MKLAKERIDLAIPRVFVSSTCYDLHYIRENLKFFIRNMGFEPILGEEGGIYFDPSLHVQEACLAEVPNCQMFVLVIGGRFGSKFKDKPESVVNHEYREAIKQKIPVFAMVEQQVYGEYHVYQKNKGNNAVNASKINYPGVDSPKIFEFMEEVQTSAVNNALVPFSDFNELESYLKKQWAGLMFSFLTRKSESERVANMLEVLATMSNKIEFLSKQILSSVGATIPKINAELYEVMSKYMYEEPLMHWTQYTYSPSDVIENEELEGILAKAQIVTAKDANGRVSLKAKVGRIFSKAKWLDENEFAKTKSRYTKFRKDLLKILEKHEIKPEDFLKRLYEPSSAGGKETHSS